MRAMRALLLIALLYSPADPAELWALHDKDCSEPAILISPETKELERLDFTCRITSSNVGPASSTYAANCDTDEPAKDEPTTVTVTPQSDGTAIIDWSGVDSDRYKLCPGAEPPATM